MTAADSLSRTRRVVTLCRAMNAAFRYTENDWVDAYRTRILPRQLVYIGAPVLGLVGVLCAPSWVSTTLFGCVAFMLIAFLLLPRGLYRVLGLGRIDYTLDDHGISMRVGEKTQLIRWDQFISGRNHDRWYILETKGKPPTMIPKVRLDQHQSEQIEHLVSHVLK